MPCAGQKHIFAAYGYGGNITFSYLAAELLATFCSGEGNSHCSTTSRSIAAPEHSVLLERFGAAALQARCPAGCVLRPLTRRGLHFPDESGFQTASEYSANGPPQEGPTLRPVRPARA